MARDDPPTEGISGAFRLWASRRSCCWSIAHAPPTRGCSMMEHMGGMMAGMGLVGLLGIVVLLLAAAALVKYLFFNRRR